MAASRPGSVLFACNYNAVRSPMAEGLAKRLFGSLVYVDSVGVRETDEVDGFAVAVMEELGIDISGVRPKTFEGLDDTSFDLVVTLTPRAQHKALELTRTMAVEVEYWPTFDPTATLGNREVVLAAYRQTRDDLKRRIEARFAELIAAAGPVPGTPKG